MAGPVRCLQQVLPLLRLSASRIAGPLCSQAHLKFGEVLPPDCRKSWTGNQNVHARHFSSKKAKTKGKGQARVNINAALVADIVDLEEVKADMGAVVKALQDDFNKSLSIRTSSGALDHILVTTKDGKFPLNQLGHISLKSPQLMVVNMSNFPETTAAAIKAIQESGMNLNPEADGLIIRVPIPKVTREHRENLAALAKQLSNKAKEALRKVRAEAVSQAKKAKGSVSEDTIHLIEKQVQQMTDDTTAELDSLLAAKKKELLG